MIKKAFILFCFSIVLGSCKPSPQRMYVFNEETDGIVVRHLEDEQKFEITLKKKDSFVFSSLTTYEHIYLRSSNELSFYDSFEGRIEFASDERSYVFKDNLDKRCIEIRYTDEVAESINYCLRCLRLKIFDKNFIYDANA